MFDSVYMKFKKIKLVFDNKNVNIAFFPKSEIGRGSSDIDHSFSYMGINICHNPVYC